IESTSTQFVIDTIIKSLLTSEESESATDKSETEESLKKPKKHIPEESLKEPDYSTLKRKPKVRSNVPEQVDSEAKVKPRVSSYVPEDKKTKVREDKVIESTPSQLVIDTIRKSLVTSEESESTRDKSKTEESLKKPRKQIPEESLKEPDCSTLKRKPKVRSNESDNLEDKNETLKFYKKLTDQKKQLIDLTDMKTKYNVSSDKPEHVSEKSYSEKEALIQIKKRENELISKKSDISIKKEKSRETFDNTINITNEGKIEDKSFRKCLKGEPEVQVKQITDSTFVKRKSKFTSDESESFTDNSEPEVEALRKGNKVASGVDYSKFPKKSKVTSDESETFMERSEDVDEASRKCKNVKSKPDESKFPKKSIITDSKPQTITNTEQPTDKILTSKKNIEPESNLRKENISTMKIKLTETRNDSNEPENLNAKRVPEDKTFKKVDSKLVPKKEPESLPKKSVDSQVKGKLEITKEEQDISLVKISLTEKTSKKHDRKPQESSSLQPIDSPVAEKSKLFSYDAEKVPYERERKPSDKQFICETELKPKSNKMYPTEPALIGKNKVTKSEDIEVNMKDQIDDNRPERMKPEYRDNNLVDVAPKRPKEKDCDIAVATDDNKIEEETLKSKKFRKPDSSQRNSDQLLPEIEPGLRDEQTNKANYSVIPDKISQTKIKKEPDSRLRQPVEISMKMKPQEILDEIKDKKSDSKVLEFPKKVVDNSSEISRDIHNLKHDQDSLITKKKLKNTFEKPEAVPDSIKPETNLITKRASAAKRKDKSTGSEPEDTVEQVIDFQKGTTKKGKPSLLKQPNDSIVSSKRMVGDVDSDTITDKCTSSYIPSKKQSKEKLYEHIEPCEESEVNKTPSVSKPDDVESLSIKSCPDDVPYKKTYAKVLTATPKSDSISPPKPNVTDKFEPVVDSIRKPEIGKTVPHKEHIELEFESVKETTRKCNDLTSSDEQLDKTRIQTREKEEPVSHTLNTSVKRSQKETPDKVKKGKPKDKLKTQEPKSVSVSKSKPKLEEDIQKDKTTSDTSKKSSPKRSVTKTLPTDDQIISSVKKDKAKKNSRSDSMKKYDLHSDQTSIRRKSTKMDNSVDKVPKNTPESRFSKSPEPDDLTRRLKKLSKHRKSSICLLLLLISCALLNNRAFFLSTW
ncbi:unnamed protein product, partial [Rotaria magnacalcarata]